MSVASSLIRRFLKEERIEIINIDTWSENEYPLMHSFAEEWIKAKVSLIVTGTRPQEDYQGFKEIAKRNNIWPLCLQM